MKKQVHRDVWVGLFLLVVCAWFLIMSLAISGEASYLPIALSVLMGICCVSIAINGIRKTKAAEGEIHYAMSVKSSWNAFMFMGFIFIYYLMFNYISYWIATPVFMIYAQKHLKVKSWKMNLLVAVIYLIISYVLFVIILKLPIYKVGILGEYFRYI